MASTNAMLTGLTSLNAHAQSLEVISNNIANVSTTSFKSSRASFQSQFFNTLSPGSDPQGTFGGANPFQVGTGVQISGTRVDFTQGAIAPTGNPNDLAIDGKGFFVVDNRGSQRFTRDGSFRTNLNNELVTITGDRVMGYGVDRSYQIDQGTGLVPLTLPVGQLTIAEASRTAQLFGNLNSAGQVATSGTIIDMRMSATEGLRVLPGTPLTPGSVISEGTLLTQVADPSASTGNVPMFQPGQTLEINGATLGGSRLETKRLEITATSTIQELLLFIQDSVGIQITGPNPDGSIPGVSIDTTDGVIRVTGNSGTLSEIELNNDNFRLLDANQQLISFPLFPAQFAEATGEAVRTTMVVYDSLGTPIDVDVTMTLVGVNPAGGTFWRYDVFSSDDSDRSPAVLSGQATFDAFGQIITPDRITASIDLRDTGAATPLTFDIEFSGDSGRVTALASDPSDIRGLAIDGLPTGTLEAYSIAADGTIIGSFTNSATRSLGRLAIATFENQEGLSQQTNNLYAAGPNSGPALLANPGNLGTGRVVSGALEQSNVDLGQEFVDLILVQTGYSAASRIIQTSDELLQQLLVLGR